ncbi:MAG: cupin domain-containing protein [Nanoarchaeota archaeon]|nr:cupin domain-containing protein [Nanoarchaeota archaeon]MBU1946379.1 cupin domain-containing protein [Nanoarchaeota archaeon]
MSKHKEVPKVWGKEIWIVNRNYCGKKLILNKGYRCSMHHHKVKDETFYILKGKVLLESNNSSTIMLPGDSILIEPNTKHRFTGLEDSEIMEFSTHHKDEDSYRENGMLSGKVDLSKIQLPLAAGEGGLGGRDIQTKSK